MTSNFCRVFKQIVVLLVVTATVSACRQQDDKPPLQSGFGAIVGANYTDNGIQWFTVDGAGGMRLGTYSGGGGHVCCASYPRTWTPAFKVKVKWARSDGRDESGTGWKMKAMEKTVAVEKYVDEGNVYVLFFPNDEVKVFVSVVGIGSPDFPTKPGYPEDAAKAGEAR